MDERSPFIRAILEIPDDDLPRLVYADWLDERGESARAEFIRLQCEQARLAPVPQAEYGLYDSSFPSCDPHRWSYYKSLRERELILLRENVPDWVAGWSTGLTGLWFRRGFVEQATTSAAMFLSNAHRWFAREPIIKFHLHSIGSSNQALAEFPLMRWLRELDIGWGGDDRDHLVERLVESHFCTNLRRLYLHRDISEPNVRRLIRSTRLPALEYIGPYSDENSLSGFGWMLRRAFRRRFRVKD